MGGVEMMMRKFLIPLHLKRNTYFCIAIAELDANQDAQALLHPPHLELMECVAL